MSVAAKGNFKNGQPNYRGISNSQHEHNIFDATWFDISKSTANFSTQHEPISLTYLQVKAICISYEKIYD